MHLPGVFLNCFLQEASQEDGRNKNWTMQWLLNGTLRLRCSPNGEQIQNGRTADEIPKDPITPRCGPSLFCPCFSLGETSVGYTNLGPNQHSLHPIGQHAVVFYIINVCQYHLQQVLFRGYTLQYREKRSALSLFKTIAIPVLSPQTRKVSPSNNKQ